MDLYSVDIDCTDKTRTLIREAIEMLEKHHIKVPEYIANKWVNTPTDSQVEQANKIISDFADTVINCCKADLNSENIKAIAKEYEKCSEVATAYNEITDAQDLVEALDLFVALGYLT